MNTKRHEWPQSGARGAKLLGRGVGKHLGGNRQECVGSTTPNEFVGVEKRCAELWNRVRRIVTKEAEFGRGLRPGHRVFHFESLKESRNSLGNRNGHTREHAGSGISDIIFGIVDAFENGGHCREGVSAERWQCQDGLVAAPSARVGHDAKQLRQRLRAGGTERTGGTSGDGLEDFIRGQGQGKEAWYGGDAVCIVNAGRKVRRGSGV
jgi:hypothetical protein